MADEVLLQGQLEFELRKKLLQSVPSSGRVWPLERVTTAAAILSWLSRSRNLGAPNPTGGIGVAVPAVQVSGLEDDWDAVVNRSNQIVRIESWRLWIR